MKTIIFTTIFLTLVGIGWGQNITVKQQEVFNKGAEWKLVSDEVSMSLFIDLKSIERKESFVYFRTKIISELSTNYFSVLGSCDNPMYIYTNVFGELPDESLYKRVDMDDDVREAERDSPMHKALVYVCHYNPKSKK